MAEGFVDVLGGYGMGEEVVIFIISLFPILELRGGLVAAALLGVPIERAAVICFIGNILPIPIILIFIEQIFKILRRFGFFDRLIDKIKKSAEKRGEKLKKAQWWGLFTFVAIPLPGTGGWTGALISVLLGMPIKRSFITIMAGVACADVIMLTLTYFIPGLFF